MLTILTSLPLHLVINGVDAHAAMDSSTHYIPLPAVLYLDHTKCTHTSFHLYVTFYDAIVCHVLSESDFQFSRTSFVLLCDFMCVYARERI